MSVYQHKKTPGDTAWFVHDRFGMFLHFGLYALPARHEWVKNRECIPEEKYDVYFRHFNPDLCDPREWARRAKAAGMKYAILTTKHHEGFCLFDSQYTDYKSTNTPCGRDLVREYADAFRAEGLHVGFYYSLIDWHHPDFTIDSLHPRRNDPDVARQNEGRDMHRYAQYMRNQVTELLTNYGDVDILWFDFSYPDKRARDWEAEELIRTARALRPGIIINNRTDIEEDLWTPEQYQVNEWVRHEKTGELVTWEACHTFSGSWGYYRDESSWKSPEMLVKMLIGTVACGGNLIMNVGPTARGNFDARAVAALDAYGAWMHLHSRAIYGCTMADPDILKILPNGCRYTQSEDGRRLYIHLFDYPFENLEVPGLAGRVEYAQFLNDASEIPFTEGRIQHWAVMQEADDTVVNFRLPAVRPDVIVPVIEVFLKS